MFAIRDDNCKTSAAILSPESVVKEREEIAYLFIYRSFVLRLIVHA
jgi:hypothetical protein